MRLVLVAIVMTAMQAEAGDLPTVAGAAFGTTYRVTLAAPLAGRSMGKVHRDIDRLLAEIDRATSTWRDDSDASRFARVAVGEWLEIHPDLARLLDVARRVHDETGGAFDVTAGPLVRLMAAADTPSAADVATIRARVGMKLIELRPARDGQPAAIRKLAAGVELDVAGIGPGYAVDRIGERLVELGSANHLVELGGEVRAWGERTADEPWRVRLGAGDRTLAVPAGLAVATASLLPGRVIVDPRTGAGVSGPAHSVTVLADSCGRADAWAVAAVVLGLVPDDDGVVRLRGGHRRDQPGERAGLEPDEQSHQGGERE